jgi:NADPH:quinone reductase-like Zn-dependent oxidoreductase
MTLESEVYVVQDPVDLATLPSAAQPQSAEQRAELRRNLAAKAFTAISEVLPQLLSVSHIVRCAKSALIPQFDSAAAAAMRQGAFPAENKHRVLVLGGGGREHAIALALARSAAVKIVFVSPGNSGTALLGGAPADPSLSAVLNVAAMVPAQVATFAEEQGVDLVIVGPEQLLADGVADVLKEKVSRCSGQQSCAQVISCLLCFLQGIPCFGPSRAASRIESSKAWAKEFMRRHGIPTAAFEVFRDFPAAEAHLRSVKHPVVLKVGVACRLAVNVCF